MFKFNHLFNVHQGCEKIPEHEIIISRLNTTVTIKSSDPEFIEKWWKVFKGLVIEELVPYPEKRTAN